jgi:hypothetical protein
MIYDLEKENKEILADIKTSFPTLTGRWMRSRTSLSERLLILLWMLTKTSAEKQENHTSIIR